MRKNKPRLPKIFLAFWNFWFDPIRFICHTLQEGKSQKVNQYLFPPLLFPGHVLHSYITYTLDIRFVLKKYT